MFLTSVCYKFHYEHLLQYRHNIVFKVSSSSLPEPAAKASFGLDQHSESLEVRGIPNSWRT